MKAGDQVYVHHVSLGYEGEGPDVIGRGVLLTDPANGDVWVRMDQSIDYQRDFHVSVVDVTVLP